MIRPKSENVVLRVVFCGRRVHYGRGEVQSRFGLPRTGDLIGKNWRFVGAATPAAVLLWRRPRNRFAGEPET